MVELTRSALLPETDRMDNQSYNQPQPTVFLHHLTPTIYKVAPAAQGRTNKYICLPVGIEPRTTIDRRKRDTAEAGSFNHGGQLYIIDRNE